MKILLFVDKLFGGGAERVASILLNHLCEKHNVTAIIFNDKRPTYPLKPQILIHKINVDGKIRILHPIERIHKIREVINQNNPDLIISFMVSLNMYVVIANCNTHTKLILTEHTTIQAKQTLFEWFTRHALYRFASKVVFVTKSDYNYAHWLKAKTCIYNPLSYPVTTSHCVREKTIIAISSLRRWYVKGFDMLIKAWAKIAQKYPDWKLHFIGATDDDKIINLAKLYKADNQVVFEGWSNEIDKIMRNTNIFVLSSRQEGFPCSLLEAMSQGCACVAFDCQTGPNEIITNGVNGLLANNGDIDDLSSKLQSLIEDENLRKQIAHNAIKDVQQFDESRIMKDWDELIEGITAK